MNISEFRYIIQILTPTSVKDEFGAETITYTTLYTLRASKKSIGGSKGVDANEIFTTNNLIFETHYRSGITDDCIIFFENYKYRINQITEIGYRTGLSFQVEKINE